jgi:RNA polymerase sigma-70 factor (ECF subfamily)
VKSPDESQMQRLIQEWQGVVYSVCLRMLGRPADAEDATQEVFQRVLTRPEAYDPARAFKPWVCRVARNVVLNRLRAEKTRAAKTESYEPRARAEAREDPVDRKERETVVQRQLEGLPVDERLLLTLHYYSGLSKTEMAEVLDVPRTTIQSRVANALEQLKAQLTRVGYAGLAPVVGDVMESAPAALVPAHLTRSLYTLAAKTAAASAAGAGFVIGGIVVTKKLLITAGVLLALGSGGGFVAARMITDGAAQSESFERAELARLESENRRLADRIVALEDRGPELAGVTEGGLSRGDVPRAGPSGAKAAPKTAASRTSGVDWERFANQYAASFDTLAAARGTDWEDLTKDQRATLLALLQSVQDLSERVRLVSPTPFFDDVLLPEFVDAVFGASGGLGKEARTALQAHARALLKSEMEGLDAATSLPVELYAARERIVEGLREHLGSAVPADKRERVAKVLEFSEDLLMGERESDSIGLAPDAEGRSTESRVLAKWTRVFGLSEAQAQAIAPLASSLAQAGAQVVRRYGQVDGAEAPEAKTQAAMNAEFLRLQIEAEAAVGRALTKEQRAALRGVPPSLLRFNAGQSRSSMMHRGGGI